MHTTQRCDSLRLNVGPIEPPKPSQAKQGTQFPEVILAPSALRGKRRVQKPLEGFSPLNERATACLLSFLAAEKLVGDVQRRQHGEPQRVARRSGFGRRTHFL